MSQVWFVTGSSRGLGRAIAEAALADGDQVVATARRTAHLDGLVERYGENVRPIALDVTDPEQVHRVVQQGLDAFGHYDVVVNNAGYADVAAIEDVTLEYFRAQIDTNFFGVVHVTKAVLPALRERGSGHIFQVSSLGGRFASPGLGAYQSAKWAIGGFSTGLAPGGRTAGHPGHRARTRWDAHRLGRLVDDDPRGQRALPADRGTGRDHDPLRLRA